LLISFAAASSDQQLQLVETKGSSLITALDKLETFFTNYYQNLWFFVMRTLFDMYCMYTAFVYVSLFNDGG
jgi:hypothetical protein